MGGVFSRLPVSACVHLQRGEAGIPRWPLTIKHFVNQTRPAGNWGGDLHCPEVDLSHCPLPIAILESSPHQGFRGWDRGGRPAP